MRSTATAISILILAALTVSVASATVPPRINYQGHLTDGGGAPLNGYYDLWFAIYGDSTDWTPLYWTEQHMAVLVDDGLFSVLLGRDYPLTADVFDDDECWLSISIGGDPEIRPRMRFTSVPWALRAAVADSVLYGGGTAPHDHDSLYCRKYELYNPGFINTPTNPVDWTKLKNVPAGIADGVDSVGTGGGFSLPYQGESYTSSSAFWVRNLNGGSVGSAIKGEHLTTGAVGQLGYGTYGVYGYSASDWAAYFEGKSYFGGWVGIGTTAPQSPLHVEGTLTLDNTIRADDTDGLYFASAGGYAMRIQDNGYVGIGTTAPETQCHINGTLTLDQKLMADDAGGLELATDEGTTRVKITDGGLVGIGTLTPETGLHVKGSLTVDNAIYADDEDGLYINTAGGYAMRLLDNGYVGIGTNTPETLCHINGSLTVDQTILADDSGGLNFATDDGGIQMKITDDGDIGIGTTDPGSHQLCVKSSGGGASGATLYCENDNATNGIAASFDNESSDVTVLMAQHGSGDILRCDSWVGGWHWVFKVENDGRTTVSELVITGGADLSENFDVDDAASVEVKPGMVVSIDPVNAGKLTVSREGYDRRVAGVVSGAGGVETGVVMGQKGTEADGDVPVALTGRVYCWADASHGAIEPGDLLTSSTTPGHAMKVTDYERSNGAILGKAMSSLDSGKGLVLVLVTLQ